MLSDPAQCLCEASQDDLYNEVLGNRLLLLCRLFSVAQQERGRVRGGGRGGVGGRGRDRERIEGGLLLLFVGCLASQQRDCLSQGRICSDIFTVRHTEIEVADQTFYLTQSQHTNTGPTSPSADPLASGAWQGTHLSDNF